MVSSVNLSQKDNRDQIVFQEMQSQFHIQKSVSVFHHVNSVIRKLMSSQWVQKKHLVKFSIHLWRKGFSKLGLERNLIPLIMVIS